MMLSAERAGGINALCLSFPLVSVFGLKVLQESREGLGRLMGSGHQGLGGKNAILVLSLDSELRPWKASPGAKH